MAEPLPPTLEDQVKALKAKVVDLEAKLEKANDRGEDLSKISRLESALADANKQLEDFKSKNAQPPAAPAAPAAPATPEKKKPGPLEGWV